jgi:hypothetical protein
LRGASNLKSRAVGLRIVYTLAPCLWSKAAFRLGEDLRRSELLDETAAEMLRRMYV